MSFDDLFGTNLVRVIFDKTENHPLKVLSNLLIQVYGITIKHVYASEHSMNFNYSKSILFSDAKPVPESLRNDKLIKSFDDIKDEWNKLFLKNDILIEKIFFSFNPKSSTISVNFISKDPEKLENLGYKIRTFMIDKEQLNKIKKCL